MGWQADVRKVARQEGVDPRLAVALVRQESGGNQGAVSPAGAIGMTQLMPGTAAGLGVNPHDYWQNIRGGLRYLKQQLKTFGDVRKALAAYNAGPGAVQKYGGIPPYAETRNYVSRIMAAYGGGSGTTRRQARKQARQSANGGGGGGTPPITLYGIGGDANAQTPADLALALVGGRMGMLDFAMGMKALEGQSAALPQDVVLPGVGPTPSGGRERGAGGPQRAQGGRGTTALDIAQRVKGLPGMGSMSGMRTSAHNAAVGGSPTSDHISDDKIPGRAWDFPTNDRKVQRRAAQVIARQLGIKLTGSFTQAETRIDGRRARVQIIYGSEHGHGDHLHWGIRWLD